MTDREPADVIFDLLRESDRHTYGEGVTMLQHALQTASDVETAGGDEALVIAALLHDLGHLIGAAGEWGDPDHAAAGAHFLAPWLPADVVEPIRLHVAAKRHLVATDPDYTRLLSYASRVTLAQQGGPFTPHEAAEFAALPHADRAILLRRADDSGKRVGAATPPLESFRERLTAALDLRG